MNLDSFIRKEIWIFFKREIEKNLFVINFLININKKQLYSLIIICLCNRISHCAYRHNIHRYIDNSQLTRVIYRFEIISISGHRRPCVMEFAWTRTEQFSSMDIRTGVPISFRCVSSKTLCYPENGWSLDPGRFSALPFDLRQQANVFVHPCILNLSTFSSVFFFPAIPARFVWPIDCGLWKKVCESFDIW